jgi:hypothetical protein
MSLEITISKINSELISAFAVLDSWFDRNETLLRQRCSIRWCPAEILEHVMLTNHYLLILIEKGSSKALKLAGERDLTHEVRHYQLNNAGLEEIGDPESFAWERPPHMEPEGIRPLREVREELRNQLYRCLCQLDALCKGQGIAYRISMSVNRLGKLDMYQYIYFLALHARRHIRQLEKFYGPGL